LTLAFNYPTVAFLLQSPGLSGWRRVCFAPLLRWNGSTAHQFHQPFQSCLPVLFLRAVLMGFNDKDTLGSDSPTRQPHQAQAHVFW